MSTAELFAYANDLDRLGKHREAHDYRVEAARRDAEEEREERTRRRRLRAWLFGSRKRKVFAVALAALLIPAVAVAAFVIYSGVNGSGSGSFANAQNAGAAITVNGVSSPEIPGAGTAAQMEVTVVNNDPSAQHHLDTLTGTFSSNVNGCGSHLSLQSFNALLTNYAAGSTTPGGTVSIAADPSLPSNCAGATWSVQFSGTTTP